MWHREGGGNGRIARAGIQLDFENGGPTGENKKEQSALSDLIPKITGFQKRAHSEGKYHKKITTHTETPNKSVHTWVADWGPFVGHTCLHLCAKQPIPFPLCMRARA